MSQLVFDDDLANQLDTLYRTDVLRRRRLVREALAAAPGERVLDVGQAGLPRRAASRTSSWATGSVVGVDASPRHLALARRRTRATTTSSCTAPCAPAAGWSSGTSTGRPCSWHSADPGRMRRVLAIWDGHLADPCLPRTLAAGLRSAGFGDIRAEGHTFASAEFTPNGYGAAILPLIQRYVAGHGDFCQQPDQPWPTQAQRRRRPPLPAQRPTGRRVLTDTRRATSFWLDAPSPWRSHRLDTGRALVDPAQDRLGTFQVITPGHPLVPPRDPEVGQRADKVTAGCRRGGAHAADNDVERLVREPVLGPAAA